MLYTRVATALLFSIISSVTLAEDISCRVVGVHDGDTLTCLTDSKKQMKVRLAEVDTPESRQPYGTRSKQVLSALVFGKQVNLKVQGSDRYGRTVARVYTGSIDVNAQLVSEGAAWVYRQYSRDKRLIKLEEKARVSKRGLWALPESERMPPWEWRKAVRSKHAGGASNIMERSVSGSVLGGGAGGSSYSCDTRKTCSKMGSCEEARYHLRQCGNSRLDGNSDGVPCESLCR